MYRHTHTHMHTHIYIHAVIRETRLLVHSTHREYIQPSDAFLPAYSAMYVVHDNNYNSWHVSILFQCHKMVFPYPLQWLRFCLNSKCLPCHITTRLPIRMLSMCCSLHCFLMWIPDLVDHSFRQMVTTIWKQRHNLQSCCHLIKQFSLQMVLWHLIINHWALKYSPHLWLCPASRFVSSLLRHSYCITFVTFTLAITLLEIRCHKIFIVLIFA